MERLTERDEYGNTDIVGVDSGEQQLTNGWIPVSERLPKEDGNYLVTMKHKEFNQTKVTSMDFNGEFLFNDYFEKAWWEVTAWQNLPDPYKELATDNNVVTIGDKIRESNESLADLIRNFDNICNYCIAYKSAKCKTTSCGDGVLEYLNQPYKD